MSVFEQLQNKFKKIFLLNLTTRKDRLDTMFDQLFYFGLPEDYQQANLDIKFTVPFLKYNKIMMYVLNQNKLGKLTKPNEVDCTHNHYAMVKQAYDHGYEYCLIMEDDIRFYLGKEEWRLYLEHIPEDFDILQFGGFTADPKIKDYLDLSKWWVKHPTVPVWNASMYALSRKGMEYYLDFIDKFFWVADGPLYRAPIDKPELNTYICTMPLVIQEDKNVDPSDIRDKQNDNIDYNTQNMYEYKVNRGNYWNKK